MLELKNVTKRFGGLVAVDDLDLTISKGEIVGLIGPNGAGKTTVLNVITGVYRCTSGAIVCNGEDITSLNPRQVAEKGISRTFQATNVFGSMSAFDNVIMGAHLQSGLDGFGSLVPSSRTRSKWALAADRAMELLRFCKMEEVADITAGDLSHRHQRLLQIVIALACEPQTLLLDEPVAGMNLEEIDFAMDLINKIRNLGIAILLIEHNMKAVMEYCERIVVLDYGRKIAEGPPEEIKSDENVIKAYLGTPELIA